MKFTSTLVALLLGAGVMFGADSTYESLYEGIPFDMPVIDKPTFPNNQVSLADFGAVSDGVSLNTKAFADAIDYLSSKGGGTLNVPSGVWYTGPIVMKSNINLHLEGGALILFSGDESLYETIYTVYEGYEAYRTQSPIYGENLENIAITGEGVIDGNGAEWRQVKRDKTNAGQWKRFVQKSGMYTCRVCFSRILRHGISTL